MIHIVLQELDQQPVGPRMILGDLNADLDDLPAIKSVIDDATYVDLGAQIHLSSNINAPTCFPPNHHQPTRRDYAIISSDFLPFVKAFHVHPPDEIP
eukprot:5509768-Karenia_brevis.AAC.1